MRTANPAWLLVAVIANAGILGFWSSFWRDLLPRGEQVSYGNMFRIASIASAVMNTVPFLAGHASSVVLLIRRGGVSRHGALSVLALDQLGEGIAKMLIFVIVALLAPLPSWMRAGILTSSLAVGALFVVLLVSAHRHHAAIPDDAAPNGTLERARAFFARWAYGLEVLRSWPRAWVALTCVLAMKGVEAVAIFSVQQSFGVSLPLS